MPRIVLRDELGAKSFGASIGADRVGRIRFRVPFRLHPVEFIIGGEMNDGDACLSACFGQVRGIGSIHHICGIGLVFRSVHIGIRDAIHENVGLLRPHMICQSRSIAKIDIHATGREKYMVRQDAPPCRPQSALRAKKDDLHIAEMVTMTKACVHFGQGVLFVTVLDLSDEGLCKESLFSIYHSKKIC